MQEWQSTNNPAGITMAAHLVGRGEHMKIAFIGIGSMGAAIVPRLLAAGHEVWAWNRTREAVDGIAGVKHLNRPADAFKYDAVISMLSDDRAVRDVFFARAPCRPKRVRRFTS